MGMIEEILQNKEELIIKFLQIIEGKEARAKVNLDGVVFHVGNSAVKMDGTVEFTLIPVENKR